MADSKYLATARAIGGDDIWCDRLRIACQIEGLEYDETAAVNITYACVDSIALGEDGLTVSTSAVTDEQIQAAIKRLLEGLPDADSGEDS